MRHNTLTRQIFVHQYMVWGAVRAVVEDAEIFKLGEYTIREVARKWVVEEERVPSLAHQRTRNGEESSMGKVGPLVRWSGIDGGEEGFACGRWKKGRNIVD